MLLSVHWYITHVAKALGTATFIMKRRPETSVIYQYVRGNSPKQWNCQLLRDLFFSFFQPLKKLMTQHTTLNTFGFQFYQRQINRFSGHLINRFVYYSLFIFSPNGATVPSGPGSLCDPGFTITFRLTLGRTPLDEWSARRRKLYLTTYNTHKRQTSMPPAGLEPAIPACERPQTHTLDHTATGIEYMYICEYYTYIRSLSVAVLRWKWEGGVIKEIGI